MPTPKIDTGYPTGTYPDPAEGFFGYPAGTATRESPYPYGSYPVPDENVPCSNPTGCPVGIAVVVSGGPSTFTLITTDVPGHTTVWDFGDGSPRESVPSDQSIDHTYATPGDYTVTAICHQAIATTTVTVSAGGGGATVAYDVTWNPTYQFYVMTSGMTGPAQDYEATFNVQLDPADGGTTTVVVDLATYLGAMPSGPAPAGSLRTSAALANADAHQMGALDPSTVYSMRFTGASTVVLSPGVGVPIPPDTGAYLYMGAASVTQPPDWHDGAPHPVALDYDTGITAADWLTVAAAQPLQGNDPDGGQTSIIAAGAGSGNAQVTPHEVVALDDEGLDLVVAWDAGRPAYVAQPVNGLLVVGRDFSSTVLRYSLGDWDPDGPTPLTAKLVLPSGFTPDSAWPVAAQYSSDGSNWTGYEVRHADGITPWTTDEIIAAAGQQVTLTYDATNSWWTLATAVAPPSPYLTPSVGTVTTPDPGLLPAQSILVAKVTQAPAAGNGVIAGQYEVNPNRSWCVFRNGAVVAGGAQIVTPTGNDFDSVQQVGPGPLSGAAATGNDEWVAFAGDLTVWNVRYLTSVDGTTWVDRGVGATVAPITPFDSSDVVRIGARSAGTNMIWNGRIYWAELRTGLIPTAGTVLWRFDASEYPGTGTSYTDPRGRTWTLTSPSAITIP